MPKVYSYVRMSTAEQLQGDSLRRQLEGTREFAAKLGLEVDGHLHDLGKSAFRGGNVDGDASLARFLDLLETGRIEPGSYLVVESLDRLSRQNVEVSFDLLRRIISKGVSVATLRPEQMIYSPGSFESITPLLFALTGMMRSHEESKTKSERVGKAWKQKKIRAAKLELISRRVPSWLIVTDDGIAAVPERAALVREIFEMLRDGWGAYSVARELNRRGIQAWSGRHRSVWRESFIKKLVYGRTVLGEYHPHRLSVDKDRAKGRRVPDGDPIVGYYPQVVDQSLYDAAHAAIAGRRSNGRGRKGAGYSNLFTGLLRCGMCGAGMTYMNKGAPPKGGRYVRCSVSNANGSCVARAWRYEVIEAALLESMEELDVSYVLEGRPREVVRAELMDKARRVEDEIEMYEKRIARAVEAIRLTTAPIPGLVADSAEDQQQLDLLVRRRAGIARQIGELSDFNAEVRRQRLDELLSAISTDANEDRKSEVRRALAAEIRVSLEKIIVRGVVRVTHEILTDVPDWLEAYDGLTIDELEEVFRRLDFEFVFVYRNGREHHIDPVTRDSTSFRRTNRFNMFKEAVRLRDRR